MLSLKHLNKSNDLILPSEKVDGGRIIIHNDCFINIFNTIKKCGSFDKLTEYYSAIKWLDGSLSVVLSRLNNIMCNPKSIEYDNNIKNKCDELIHLGKEFIYKLDNIIVDRISIYQKYNNHITNYFNNINPHNDLDFKKHNNQKYSSNYDTSGYYSGLQKDWMERVYHIDHMYSIAEFENIEKIRRKEKSLIDQVKNYIGYKKINEINNKQYAIQEKPENNQNDMDGKNNYDNIGFVLTTVVIGGMTYIYHC